MEFCLRMKSLIELFKEILIRKELKSDGWIWTNEKNEIEFNRMLHLKK